MSKIKYILVIAMLSFAGGCSEPDPPRSLASSAPGWSIQPTTSKPPAQPDDDTLDRNHAFETLRKEGYDTDGVEIPPTGPVRAIVALCSGFPSGKCMGVLFFEGSRFAGTLGGAAVEIDSQDGRTVVLSFPQYRQGDAWSNPSGGDSKHTVRIVNGKPVATPPIPDDANNVKSMI